MEMPIQEAFDILSKRSENTLFIIDGMSKEIDNLKKEIKELRGKKESKFINVDGSKLG